MKYKIVVDSSSNLTSDYIKDDEVGFAVAPLTIRVGGKEYVDNDTVDVDELLDNTMKSEEAGKTSCPSPQDFLNTYEDAEHVIVVTISSKLSGSYNSAVLAKNMSANPDNVHVIDSKLVAGAIRIVANKAYELIKKGLEYTEICKKLDDYSKTVNLLFVLDKFDNLVKNGRMNKVLAFVATMINIKPLCYGEDGETKIKEKIRSLQGVFKRLVVNVGKFCENTKGRICVILHTNSLENAKILKALIEQTYEFDEVIIENNRGLCAFYSLNGGIIVSF